MSSWLKKGLSTLKEATASTVKSANQLGAEVVQAATDAIKQREQPVCTPPAHLVLTDRTNSTLDVAWSAPRRPPPVPPRRASVSAAAGAADAPVADDPREPAPDGSGRFEYRVTWVGQNVDHASATGIASKTMLWVAGMAERTYDNGEADVRGTSTSLRLKYLRAGTRYTVSVRARWVPAPRHNADAVAEARERKKSIRGDLQAARVALADAQARQRAAASSGGAPDLSTGLGQGGGSGSGESVAAQRSHVEVCAARVGALEEELRELKALLAKTPFPTQWSAADGCRLTDAVTYSSDEFELLEHTERMRLYLSPSAPSPFPRFPVFFSRDTKVAKAARVTNLTLDALSKSGLADVLGITAITSSAVFARRVGKYGLAAAFFKNDIAQALGVLTKLTKGATQGLHTSVSDMSIGLYYVLWLHARERLRDPALEFAHHQPGAPGVIESEASDPLVRRLAYWLPLAMWPYRNTREAVEWVAAPAGFDLVCSSPDSRISPFPADRAALVTVSADHPDDDDDDDDDGDGDNDGGAPTAGADGAGASAGAGAGAGAGKEEGASEQAFKPGFHLLANRATRTVVLSVRGTESFTDGLQDVQAVFAPVEYQGARYWCHGEMLKAATWIATVGGAGEWFRQFAEDGEAAGRPWEFVLAGHSLGAAVAALLAIEINRLHPSLQLTVYCYCPAAAVDHRLSAALLPDAPGPVSVYSLVNRDDVVPRASAYNARQLFRKLDAVDWDRLAQEDKSALEGRVKELWRPRERRASARLDGDEAKAAVEADGKTGAGVGAGAGALATVAAADGKHWLQASAPPPPPARMVRMVSFENHQSCLHVNVDHAVALPDVSTRVASKTVFKMRPYVTVAFSLNPTPKSTRPSKTGGTRPVWRRRNRMQFWFSSRWLATHGDDLVVTFTVKNAAVAGVGSDEVLGVGSCSVADLLRTRVASRSPTPSRTAPLDVRVRLTRPSAGGEPAKPSESMAALHATLFAEFDVRPAVEDVTEEQIRGGALVRMAVPGSIVHMYRHNGTSRASRVAWDFPSLARLEIHTNLVQDHLGDNVADALREVIAQRDGKCLPAPEWEKIPDSATRVPCAVCRYSTDWSATAGSEAEMVRVTHHCYACGKIVCEDCSQRKVPIPAVGITRPRRVCDRCLFVIHDHGLSVGSVYSAFAAGPAPVE